MQSHATCCPPSNIQHENPSLILSGRGLVAMGYAVDVVRRVLNAPRMEKEECNRTQLLALRVVIFFSFRKQKERKQNKTKENSAPNSAVSATCCCWVI